MIYRRQGWLSCLAYALWQIGVVEEETVKAYQQDKSYETRDLQVEWVKKHAPQLRGFAELMSGEIGSSNDSLEGKGLVILYDEEVNIRHSISYENGEVLDPDRPEERLSLQEYLEKYSQWIVDKVLPIEGKE